mmetsp:Transcript_47428/g.122705  ORF Transcript_47428/g.122705 Transcript_47428/m.122705 type:complete len:185 (-) Transcript_47428:1752-2306(-)
MSDSHEISLLNLNQVRDADMYLYKYFKEKAERKPLNKKEKKSREEEDAEVDKEIFGQYEESDGEGSDAAPDGYSYDNLNELDVDEESDLEEDFDEKKMEKILFAEADLDSEENGSGDDEDELAFADDNNLKSVDNAKKAGKKNANIFASADDYEHLISSDGADAPEVSRVLKRFSVFGSFNSCI